MHCLLRRVCLQNILVYCIANIRSLVRELGHQNVRISNLEDTAVNSILSLCWSKAELNDGSWEFCIPIGDIEKFRKSIRHISTAEIDSKYNPLSICSDDLTYFSIRAAHYLNGKWLQGRAKLMHGLTGEFYGSLVEKHTKITTKLMS